jgi:DNA mismatch repair ATPase MutS
LRQYVTLQSGFLAALSGDIAFYLAAVGLMTRLQNQGLPLCRPKIAPMEARVCDLHEAYNLNLALYLMEQTQVKDRLIRNEVHMGDHGRILIVTGPNQGGKTTYTQMIGICHMLAQAGLWVPAAQADVSPVDGIYTHYPLEETLESATGRFGDEAQRLNRIFMQTTRYSLMLFNESLSSTSAGESLYIAQDIVRILRHMGVRAVFATHLHELAADIARLNRDTKGDSQIVSLVASRIDSGEESLQRSYKIAPGEPMGRSYAREIAAKYGISYDQLIALLKQRQILD